MFSKKKEGGASVRACIAIGGAGEEGAAAAGSNDGALTHRKKQYLLAYRAIHHELSEHGLRY